MSATTAGPIPMPADVPTPTHARTRRNTGQERQTAEATCAAIPMRVLNRMTGRRPYKLESGAYTSGAMPAAAREMAELYSSSLPVSSFVLKNRLAATFCIPLEPVNIRFEAPTMVICDEVPRKAKSPTCARTPNLTHSSQLRGSVGH